SGDHAVLNHSSPPSAAFASTTPAAVSYFCGESSQVIDNRIELFGKPLMRTSEVPLPGQHNLENVMAAAVMASLAGASHEAIASAVSTFKGVRHRLEFIREYK